MEQENKQLKQRVEAAQPLIVGAREVAPCVQRLVRHDNAMSQVAKIFDAAGIDVILVVTIINGVNDDQVDAAADAFNELLGPRRAVILDW